MTPEGLRPGQALCGRCGYHFGGGAAVREGTLMCPECGFKTPLELPGHDAARTRLAGLRTVRRRVRWAALVVFVIAALVVVLVILRVSPRLPR